MKIAILTQGFRPKVTEAANITIRMLAEELIRQGHEVFIFCNQVFKQPLTENYKGIEIRRTKAKYGSFKHQLQYFNYSNLLKKEVKKSSKEFDIIHNFSSSPLLTIRGILAKKYSKKAKLLQTIKAKTLYKWTYAFTFLLNFCDAVTVSARFLQHMLEKAGLKSSKIKIIPSYIDIEKFKPRGKAKLKKKYKYAGKTILVYYGHLSEKKGVSYLIKSIEALKKEKFLTLLVTGSSDPHIKPYEALLKQKNLQNKIKIVRNVKKIEEYVSLADAIVLPYPDLTSTEAQPSCILETMASKIPLITTNIKELRELISNKEVIFAKPANAIDLANKIIFTLNKKPNEAMLNNAYKKAIKFDYKKIIKKYIDLYKK